MGPSMDHVPREVLQGGGGGEGGSGPQKFVSQKWPNKIFPFINFVVSREGSGGGGVYHPSSCGVRPF